MEAPFLNVAPTRRRFQYDLKHLLLLFVALAAVLGWLHERSRLKQRADQIENLRRRTIVFEIGTILRSEMTEDQKRAALARHVKASDSQADVTRRLGVPDDWWTMGKGASDYDTFFYFPLATECRQPGPYGLTYDGSWDGNFFVSFDAVEKVVGVGYYGPIVGNTRSLGFTLDLRRQGILEQRRNGSDYNPTTTASVE